jgi:hypothetical protein
LGAADVPLDSACLGEAAEKLAVEERPLLVLEPALVLAAALLVVRERCELLSALDELAHAGCCVCSLPADAAASLLRVELAARHAASDLSLLADAPPTWMWLGWRTAANALTVVCRGQPIQVRRLRPEPRMAHVRGFLSADECAHIIALSQASGEMHPSRVVNYEGELGVRSDARTSESCKVPATRDRVVMRAVQRAAYLSGLSPAHSEAVQVVHYGPGQQYRPHYDYFSPEDKNYGRKCAAQGNRLLSFFVYLSGCDGGGKTVFPKLRLGFEPEAGCAVCWYNLDRHGVADERTLHAGAPVSSGEKWGLNIWLRERPRPPRSAPPSARLAKAVVRPHVCAASGEVRVAVQVRARPPLSQLTAVRPCPACGDLTGPVGLCLCRDQYIV